MWSVVSPTLPVDTRSGSGDPKASLTLSSSSSTPSWVVTKVIVLTVCPGLKVRFDDGRAVMVVVGDGDPALRRDRYGDGHRPLRVGAQGNVHRLSIALRDAVRALLEAHVQLGGWSSSRIVTVAIS